jgi:hypothetical protein
MPLYNKAYYDQIWHPDYIVYPKCSYGKLSMCPLHRYAHQFRNLNANYRYPLQWSQCYKSQYY